MMQPNRKTNFRLFEWLLPCCLFCFLAFSSCQKDLPPNPYDNVNNDRNDTTNTDELDPNSFAGLHDNIFGKTCANSGCHDGTFEPDFRTMESAYNTLVYHPVVKNDSTDPIQYRVVPGDINKSMLYRRLTIDLNGNSGIMPLSVDPGSDWFEKKDAYIQNIVNWIQGGAKDIFGNSPVRPNKQPQMQGVIAYATGSSIPLSRGGNGEGPILIPQGTSSIELWFSLIDDSTQAAQLLHNKIKFSLFMNDFENAEERDLQIMSTPKIAEGFEANTMVEYYHKITVNPYDFIEAISNNIYMRIYVKDSQNEITEIPSKYSQNNIKTYFTMKISQ